MRMPVRLGLLGPAFVTLGLCACQMMPSGVPLLSPTREPVLPDDYVVTDLTRPLDHDAPFVPHAEAFPFERVEFKEARKTGWRTGAYTCLEHMGTHVSTSLAHLPIGRSVDQVTGQQLVLPAAIVDFPASTRDGGTVTAADILADERLHGPIPAGSVVVLRTGKGALAGTDPALLGKRPDGGFWFPGWGDAAVRMLAIERRVRAIGTDAMAIDSGANVVEAPAQSAGSAAGLFFVVGLADLTKLPARGAVFVVAPLPIVGASGAPARVFALVPAKPR